MAALPRLLFVLVLVVVPVLVYATTGTLPERVATHFGRGGLANGWMTRDGYLVFMLAFTTLVPLFVVAMTGLIPRMATSQGMVANREYWLAPPRREDTLAWLASHACWLGLTLSVFLGAVHLLVLEANARVPARLDEAYLFALLGVLVVAVLAWAIGLRTRFRKAD
ncbi:MAG: DUF1648 domain-containing protein [Burkholderiales bacterium]